MLQRSLGIGMPEVTLHILDTRVVLHVRGRRAPECLMGQILDPNLLRQRFQMPLQIVADAERRSGRILEKGTREDYCGLGAPRSTLQSRVRDRAALARNCRSPLSLWRRS